MASSQAMAQTRPSALDRWNVIEGSKGGWNQQRSFAHTAPCNYAFRGVCSRLGRAGKRRAGTRLPRILLKVDRGHNPVGSPCISASCREPSECRTSHLQQRGESWLRCCCNQGSGLLSEACQEYCNSSSELEEVQAKGPVQSALHQAAKGLLATLLATSLTLQAQPAHAQGLPCEDPATYYAPIAGLRGPALKSKLHEILKDAKYFSYVQVPEALKILDATDAFNPAASSDVNDIYSTRTFSKSAQGLPEGWNREHLWPRSYGLPEGKPEFTDLHNLRPADTNVNSARGNKPFGECDRDNDATCLVPANREAGSDTATNREIWTPPRQVRGDIARALLYMAVRYEGEMPGTKDLELSDEPSVGLARMGRLSTLLKWHAIDPPSPAERLRNDRVCALYQQNRNPFVDRPELVAAIWGTGSGSPQSGIGATGGGESNGSKIAGDARNTAWVNEFHYNNTGKDEGEFVEIAVGANVDPDSVVVHLYNGANGKVYRALPVGNEALFQKGERTSGGATLYVCQLADGLQNGPADGIAVVVGDRLVEFISYEGTLTAESGPAAGLTSTPIGVAESEQTPKGSSVGLVDLAKRLWEVFARATPGLKNR